MKKMTAAIGLILALTACADKPPLVIQEARTLPPKIMLNVETISLADRSGPQPANSPYIANHFTPTIAEAIKKWASDRTQAVGQSGQMVIIIKDASLSVQPLLVEKGFSSWFTRQQGVKYVGHADVSIEAHNPGGVGMTEATATRSITLPENPTEVEKQNAYYSLLNTIMKDLGGNLESGIGSHMGDFIAGAPMDKTPSAEDNQPVTPTTGQEKVAPPSGAVAQ
ncbi:MAG: hypothetical protein WCD70_07400 [Alphaproteobacteria bacterium]